MREINKNVYLQIRTLITAVYAVKKKRGHFLHYEDFGQDVDSDSDVSLNFKKYWCCIFRGLRSCLNSFQNAADTVEKND